jgi:hypothetical protein
MSAAIPEESPPKKDAAVVGGAKSGIDNSCGTIGHSVSDVKGIRSRNKWMIQVERDVMKNTRLSCGARVVFAILRGYQGKNCERPFPSIKTLQSEVGVWNAIYDWGEKFVAVSREFPPASLFYLSDQPGSIKLLHCRKPPHGHRLSV